MRIGYVKKTNHIKIIHTICMCAGLLERSKRTVSSTVAH